MIAIVKKPNKSARAVPKDKGPRVSRAGVEHQTDQYSQRVAKRLRELRRQHGLSMQEFVDKMSLAAGVAVPIMTAYSYERGKLGGGADMGPDLYPVIAAIYGYKSANGWLPD